MQANPQLPRRARSRAPGAEIHLHLYRRLCVLRFPFGRARVTNSFIFFFYHLFLSFDDQNNDDDIKSRRPQDSLSQVVGDHRPSQRLVVLVVVPPRADSEKEAPMRIIRRRELSCAPLATKTMDFVNALALLTRCWSATHTNAQLLARQAQTRLPVLCSM